LTRTAKALRARPSLMLLAKAWPVEPGFDLANRAVGEGNIEHNKGVKGPREAEQGASYASLSEELWFFTYPAFF
jgi:hypothetical protein